MHCIRTVGSFIDDVGHDGGDSVWRKRKKKKKRKKLENSLIKAKRSFTYVEILILIQRTPKRKRKKNCIPPMTQRDYWGELTVRNSIE